MTFDDADADVIEDYSINNNTGTIVGAKFTNDSAMGLGAYSFSGDDGNQNSQYINITNGIGNFPQGSSERTVMMWFTINSSTINHALSDYGTDSTGRLWQMSGLSDKVFVGVNGHNWGVSGLSLEPDSWHHLAATFPPGETQSDKILLYLDGALLESTNVAGVFKTVNTGDKEAYIGRNTGGGRHNGSIDEFRIYERALTSSEINQIYLAGVRKGLTLNQSQTKKNEKWNVTVTVCDSAPACATPINFSFSQIENTAPNATDFVNATGRRANDNLTLYVRNVNSSDPDVADGIDTLRYLFYINTSDGGDLLLLSNTTDVEVVTNYTEDGVYGITVNVTDLEVVIGSSTYVIELDKDSPTIASFNLTNNTFTNQNLTIFLSIQDNSLPYNNSLRMFKDDITYHKNHSSTVTGTTIDLTDLVLNVTPDGNYTIELNFSDAVSESPEIESKYKKGKKGEAELIFNETEIGQVLNLREKKFQTIS